MALKDNLKKLREKAGYKQAKDFAKAANIPYSSYSTYERGSWPNEQNLIKIADMLHVSMDELLGYSQNKPDFASEFREVAHLCESIGLKITKKPDGKGLDIINTRLPDSLLFEIDSEDDLILIVKNSLNVLKTLTYRELKNKIIHEAVVDELFTYYAERNGWPIVKYPRKEK